MVKDKIISFRIKPYIQEAMLQLFIDTLIMTLVLIFLAYVGFPFIAYIAIVLAYFTFALFFHYRIALLAVLDKKKNRVCSEVIKIECFIDEYSFAGDRLGHSNIRFFYQKEMQVDRYKIKVIDSKGEKKNLRSVMSVNCSLKLSTLQYDYQIEYVIVTYLKKSRILVNVELAEELDKKTSKKQRDKIHSLLNQVNKTT